jgi:hypothetical protein
MAVRCSIPHVEGEKHAARGVWLHARAAETIDRVASTVRPLFFFGDAVRE